MGTGTNPCTLDCTVLFIIQDNVAAERGRFGVDTTTGSGTLQLADVSGTWFYANDEKVGIGTNNPDTALNVLNGEIKTKLDSMTQWGGLTKTTREYMHKRIIDHFSTAANLGSSTAITAMTKYIKTNSLEKNDVHSSKMIAPTFLIDGSSDCISAIISV